MTLGNDFAAVTLSALDGQPLARATRMLLTMGARVANTGMVWNADQTELEEWGGAPTVIEPVRGRVTLRGLEGSKRVVVTALDAGGQPTGPAREATSSGGAWDLDLGPEVTVWYLIEVER